MERLDKIILPKGRYTGYVWYSDKRQPNVFNNTDIRDKMILLASSNPFVIEGMLVVKIGNEEISYSIKYVDGQFLFCHYNLVDIRCKEDNEVKAFLASFDGAPGELRFIECWREEEDPNCEGMKTLIPQEFVFVGFKSKEGKR